MAVDNKEDHAQEFTDIERQTLRVWFDVDQAGNDTLADAVLNAGLQFEHYTSLLDDVPGNRTPAQMAKQQQLAFKLSEQLSQAEAFLNTVKKPSPAVTAATFNEAINEWARKQGLISEK